MTDDFKDEIRSRMSVDLTLNVCEYLKRYHADRIRDLWEKTESRGIEHGSAMWLEDGQPTAFNPVMGRESSIDVVNPPEEYRLGRVNISVHTHPSNTLGLSEADFKSLSGKLQFPPERVDWVGEDVVRGTAVVTRRLKEDKISIRGWTGGPAHTELSIDEQTERYQSFISDMSNADPIRRGLTAEQSMGELATACMTQVEP